MAGNRNPTTVGGESTLCQQGCGFAWPSRQTAATVAEQWSQPEAGRQARGASDRKYTEVMRVPVAVGIVAGTAIRGAAATVMMRPVLERHPNAFLITLANFGVTLSMEASQEHIRQDIVKELRTRGRARDSPIVLAGHSQGGLAVLRYAIDHPLQVRHVFSIGAPWRGSVSAGRLSRLVGGRLHAIRDMSEGSPFLRALHADLPQIADRVSNIYSTHEIFIRPYVGAHIDVPGVTNTLIATESEVARHLQMYPDLEFDDIIIDKVSHLGEMQSPEVRSRIWAKVSELTAEAQAERERVGRAEVPPAVAAGERGTAASAKPSKKKRKKSDGDRPSVTEAT